MHLVWRALAAQKCFFKVIFQDKITVTQLTNLPILTHKYLNWNVGKKTFLLGSVATLSAQLPWSDCFLKVLFWSLAFVYLRFIWNGEEVRSQGVRPGKKMLASNDRPYGYFVFWCLWLMLEELHLIFPPWKLIHVSFYVNRDKMCFLYALIKSKWVNCV